MPQQLDALWADSKDISNTIYAGIPTIQLSKEEVGSCLSRIKPHKADSSVQLTLFNTCAVTSIWRTSSIKSTGVFTSMHIKGGEQTVGASMKHTPHSD